MRKKSPNLTNVLLEIAWGSTNVPTCPRIDFVRLIRAIVTYLRLGLIHRIGGFPRANKYLSRIAMDKKGDKLFIGEESVISARRLLQILRLVGRFIFVRRLCLYQSIPLTGALIEAGFRAELVIGRAKQEIDSFQFHAWCEINGVPVNDVRQIPRGYWILTRIPKWEDSNQILRKKGGE